MERGTAITTDGWTDGWMNGHTEGRMDGWMDGQNLLKRCVDASKKSKLSFKARAVSL